MLNILRDIFDVVNKRRPTYDEYYFIRRITKLGEESGELSEAGLSVTSETNSKNKTFTDCREEAVDSAIVALDIALTRFPGEEALTDEQIVLEVEKMISKKLKKWKKKLKDKQDTM